MNPRIALLTALLADARLPALPALALPVGVLALAALSGCGRPLRIAGAPVTAPPCRTDGWAQATAAAAAPAAAAWARIGALEHASIGSFARVTLQLLALGAPADLVADTQRAAADEVAHARLAYGLASAYGGAPIGPGPLPLDGLALDLAPEDVLDALITEACVGETLSALEVTEAADRATEPGARRVLSILAEDELRHARLAWRTLDWLLGAHPGLRERAAAVFAACAELAADDGEGGLEAYGILDPATAADVRAAGFAEVVWPAAVALTRRAAA